MHDLTRAFTGYTKGGYKPLTLTNALATTPEIPMQNFVGGMVYLEANTNITALAFYGASWSTNDGTNASNTSPTFYHLMNASGAEDITGISGGSTPLCYALPADCFAFASLKIVATFASGASEQVELSLKS